MSMKPENHVLTLARKAQLICETAPVSRFVESTDLTPYLERFYELVRKDVLEEAAQVCDSFDESWYAYRKGAKQCAQSVRNMKEC